MMADRIVNKGVKLVVNPFTVKKVDVMEVSSRKVNDNWYKVMVKVNFITQRNKSLKDQKVGQFYLEFMMPSIWVKKEGGKTYILAQGD